MRSLHGKREIVKTLSLPTTDLLSSTFFLLVLLRMFEYRLTSTCKDPLLVPYRFTYISYVVELKKLNNTFMISMNSLKNQFGYSNDLCGP